MPPAPACIAQLEGAFYAEYHNTQEPLCKAALRLLCTDLVASAWQHEFEEAQRADAALRGFQEICRRRKEKGIPNSTPHKIRLNEEMLTRVLPNATPRQPASRKFVPVSRVFTNPAGQAALVKPMPQSAVIAAGLQAACDARQAAASQLAHLLLGQLQHQPAAGSSSSSKHNSSQLAQPNWTALPDKLLLFCMALMHKAGLTTYYGRYAAQQHSADAASTCAAAAAQLEVQLSSTVIRNMLRFGSGIGAELATAAGQLGLLGSHLAEAAARVWAAGSLHQLNARWMRVMSRVRLHVVLSLLHCLQCLPLGIRMRHTSWQSQAVQCTPGRQHCTHKLWSTEALEAQWAEAEEQSAASTAAGPPVPWLSTCTGDGRGGWQAMTAVGADEEGRRGGELHLLPCLRRRQHESAVLAVGGLRTHC